MKKCRRTIDRRPCVNEATVQRLHRWYCKMHDPVRCLQPHEVTSNVYKPLNLDEDDDETVLHNG
jgi:hypothetical protein